ncbi:helix-turn-helix transcriptional regulator [Streptomyces stramineus]|uniref:Helix-turn-helix transcriptional regulator n=1 Tax=Streptomyces stramineus TaxID=173861 RepID=A0ABP3JF97_9ACTN
MRKLRERAGMTASQAGALLGADQARVSNMESGRVGISADRLRTLAGHYACADEQLVEALVAMVGDRTRHWWEEYRTLLPAGQLDLAELEHHATSLRTAQTATLPGLLQTVEHARVVFGQGIPSLRPPEVEHRISYRVKRQDVLFRDDPVPYTAIIHEAALRMRFGGRDITRRQLEHILTMSERPGVTVLVLPFAAGEFPGSGQTLCYATGPVQALDTIQLDQSHGVVFHDAESKLQRYRQLLRRLEELALDPAGSRDLIRLVAREL